MGALASGLQGLGNVSENIAQGKQINSQADQQAAMNKLQLFAAQMKLQQLKQQLGNTPEAQVASIEKLLGRPLTDSEKTSLFGIGPNATAQPKTSWRVQPGPDGKPHDVLYNDVTGHPIQDAGMHYEKEAASDKPSFGGQSGQYTTADGKIGYGYRDEKSGKIYDAATNQVVTAKSFVPSSEQPTTTSSVSFQNMQMPDGSQQLVAIPTSKTSGKSGGGQVHIDQPRPIGSKALPAGTTEKLNSMISTVSPVLDAMKRMRQNSDVLSDPMSAAKIKLAASSGGLAGLISRGMTMTDKEKQYAADWETTAEGINSLRQALQATGFRGPYAWDTLLQQRGSLFGRPDVTNRVLDQSIKILQGQIDQAGTMLHGGMKPPSPVSGTSGFTRNADGSYSEQ